MKRPTRLEAFDVLYCIAAGDGREEALFGSSVAAAREVFERSLIGSGYPSVYFEFPLLGEPGFDILTVHASVEPGARFAPGAGYGYQAMFDWFSTACKDMDQVSCGLEMDTSDGETEAAGVYLQQRRHTDLVAPFLESVGEQARTQSYLDVLERMPEGWPPAYIGLFPGRPGTPMRIGGYLGHKQHRRCAEDPAYLGECFRKVGFSAYNDEMLERCAEFMRIAPNIDFQFDIMPDGTLSDTFGLSLSFNETKPRDAAKCMSEGYGAELMGHLQSWGLCDDRWKLIADAAFARHIPIELEDGSEGRFALCVLFNYAKVKFRGGVAQPAKFYLNCAARDLPEADESAEKAGQGGTTFTVHRRGAK